MNWKTIPFLFILRFFWPTIPESIPEKMPKMAKELELRFFLNRNRHSPRRDTLDKFRILCSLPGDGDELGAVFEAVDGDGDGVAAVRHQVPHAAEPPDRELPRGVAGLGRLPLHGHGGLGAVVDVAHVDVDPLQEVGFFP